MLCESALFRFACFQSGQDKISHSESKKLPSIEFIRVSVDKAGFRALLTYNGETEQHCLGTTVSLCCCIVWGVIYIRSSLLFQCNIA